LNDFRKKQKIENPQYFNSLKMFTSSVKKNRASAVANTYCFEINKNHYTIDTSCGKKRRNELKGFLKDKRKNTILCTHYHNDHIANNWLIAKKNTAIIYHKNAKSKINWLRTNSTGQILKMYSTMDKKSVLSRLGFFNKKTAAFLAQSPLISRFIIPPLLFIIAYIVSFKNTGFMFPKKRNITWLDPEKKVKIDLNSITIEGWIIDKDFYAFETPGHTDCHITFYNNEEKILFCGDALNFLNPNDIQFGSIEKTFSTIDLILNIAKDEDIKTLALGHYYPITGKENIIKYIEKIKEKHEYVYGLVKSQAKIGGCHLHPEKIYKEVINLDDPLIAKLRRINFPVSTLVFLDVFVYKLLAEIKKEITGY